MNQCSGSNGGDPHYAAFCGTAGRAGLLEPGKDPFGIKANINCITGHGDCVEAIVTDVLYAVAGGLGRLAARGVAFDEAESAGIAAARCSFTPTTPVLLKDGKTKPIGKIATGDQVEAADPATGKHQGPRTVTARLVHHDDDLVDVTIRTNDGHTASVHTTSRHPFWDDTQHAWIPAGNLTPGHALNTATNKHALVTAVKTRPGAADMYNLTVDQLHTYYVLAGTTPVLVHNSTCDVSALTAKINPDDLTMTRTVESHFNDITKQGLPARPFMKSTQVVREIMGGSDPVLDPRGAEGALRWDAPGALNGKEGTWELVVDTNTNTILHFNFVR
jgi:hypothetical protein